MPAPLLVASVTALLVAASPSALTTTAERSGFRRTARYEEVLRLCDAFAAAHPRRARCSTFGTTPEGREMKVLVLSDDGTLDPETARARARPVVYAQGGIHAGEIDGKDAGFLVARELLEGKLAPGVLEKITFVFVPVLNVDGHERFGPNNRPNQRGPEEMGWRTTAQNLNLNRDFTKADAPETQALLGLLGAWDPAVTVDLHVTDGAKFQHDVAIVVEPAVAGPPVLQEAARKLRQGVIQHVNARGHQALDFYPELEKHDDPSSGFSAGVTPLRFFHGYWSLRNRLGILVETHSWKDYQTRVRATHDVLGAVLDLARAEAVAWRAAGLALDAEGERGPGDVVLAWDNTDEKITLDFLGYAWTRVPSPVSGGMRTIYDEKKKQVWRIPFLTSVKPARTAAAPKAGYVVPAAWAPLVKAKLDLHHIRSVPLAAAAVVEGQAFRATQVTFGAVPYEGRMSARVTGSWAPERRRVERGSLFVPAAQPRGRLLVHLLEPTAPDSLVSWGSFNACFEQKEYMEDYVAEEVAERMLLDPRVRAEFQALLEKDAAFARDPEKRLEFFYRRHASWDDRKDLYPVLRVDVAP